MEAAINLRQSIDKYGDELAISRQREACLKLCEQRGRVTVEYSIIEVYTDPFSALHVRTFRAAADSMCLRPEVFEP
jgi:hypothetical protein